ncbi:hypothetical protein [Maricaulis sp.]|uniref:hypothetical protein n=1 Tax=Maricaulis sp. TaxID=1486257 RepID=UPI003A94A501
MLRQMTKTFSLAAAATLSLSAGAALADEPVSIAPIQIGDALAARVDEIGEREFDRLKEILQSDLERELAGHLGENGSVLHVTIIDADPNRPTMAAMTARPGLSMESFSLGGASLAAELVSSSGATLQTYSYAWHSHTISNAAYASTWSDARRTFDRFAAEVGASIDTGISDGS